MPCTNCGRGGVVDGYTVRFTGGERDATEMELELCEDCRGEFSTEPGIDVE